MLLTIATRVQEPGVFVVELNGRITLGRESTHIEDTVVKAIAEGSRGIVLDMAGVRYIDSSGIGIVASCFGKAAKAGGKLCVAGAIGIVMEVFQMTHLDAVIPFAPSVDAACVVVESGAQAAMKKEA